MGTVDGAMAERSRIRDLLQARGRGGVVGAADVRVGLAIGALPPLVCAISDAGVQFDDGYEPEAMFRFDCADTALALLGGGGDVVAAFMAGKFIADGHLTFVFPLLAAFGGETMDVPP